jgi:hypothetical protein
MEFERESQQQRLKGNGAKLHAKTRLKRGVLMNALNSGIVVLRKEEKRIAQRPAVAKLAI